MEGAEVQKENRTMISILYKENRLVIEEGS